MSIGLHWEARGVLRVCSGDIGFEEYMQSTAELHNDPRFDGLRYFIDDFTQVESLHMSSNDVEMVIASMIGAAYSNPHIRMAMVARSEPLRQMLAQLLRMSPYVNRVFDTQAEAREWIGSGETMPVPLEIQLQAAVDFDTRPLIY